MRNSVSKMILNGRVGWFLVAVVGVLAMILVTVSLVDRRTVTRQEAVEVDEGEGRVTAKMMFSVDAVGTVRNEMNLKVTLRDGNGNPLANKKIVFTYDAGWNYGVAVLTDSEGMASYILPTVGDDNRTGFCSGEVYQANASFQGDGQYLPVYGKLDFTKSGGNVGKEFAPETKQKRIETIPFLPFGKVSGDDEIGVPHGVLHYEWWKGFSYDFLSRRGEVTLPDGRVTKKPIIFGMPFFNINGDQSGYGSSYSTPSGSGCPWTTVPMYCDAGWQAAYLAKVEEMGSWLDGKIDGVMVSFGYDGEANFVKGHGKCENYLKENYGCTNGGFSSMLKRAIDKHIEVFPNTPVFIQGAPTDPEKAVAGNYGYKLNNFTASSGEWYYGRSLGYGNYEAWIKYPEMMKAFESKIGGSGLYRSYWMILNMLNAKPDFIDFFGNHYKVFEKLPWFFDFVYNSLGKESFESDQVWAALREMPDGAKKTAAMNPYQCQISGYYGDFGNYLYRKENLEGNKTVTMEYSDNLFRRTYRNDASNDFSYDQPFTNRSDEGPLPDENTYQPMKGLVVKTARKNAPGNHYMSFDIDNGWKYAGILPNAVLKYDIYLIYLDNGSDSLAVEYKDEGGKLKSLTINKTDSGRWIRKGFEISDAYFNDQLEGMTDIRINDNSDGFEVIHMLQIMGQGEGGVGPTMVPTVVPTVTTMPTAVPTAVPTIGPVDGDIDGDGSVTMSDFLVWSQEYLEYRESGQVRVDSRADLNGDGRINLLDFMVWRQEYLDKS